VIVAGRPHYYGQGFIFVPDSIDAYLGLLRDPPFMDEDMQSAALRYAHTLFFGLHKPLRGVRRIGTSFEYTGEPSNLVDVFGLGEE
jgi:hypothetical protein